jgi:hypothetical protein
MSLARPTRREYFGVGTINVLLTVALVILAHPWIAAYFAALGLVSFWRGSRTP